MKQTRTVFLLIFLSMLFIENSQAQVAKFQSLYIYNICRYVEWPASAPTGDFIIGIIGNNSELSSNLKSIAGSKAIQGRKVKIQTVSSTSQASTCHVVFFTAGSAGKIGSYASTTKKCLIVSESSGAIQKGSDINFYMDSNKLKFELGKSNIGKKTINISNELSQLASKVY